MATHIDDDVSFPLVRSKASPRFRPPTGEDVELDSDDDSSQVVDHPAILPDRITPSVAGGLVGFVGGAAALGVVYGLAPAALTVPLQSVAQARGVDLDVTFVVAFITAASVGALVGATFAVVTRYLRKWLPLLIWALVFFVSLSMLLMAVAPESIRALSAPILAATAVFGFIVSFSLPIRRRV